MAVKAAAKDNITAGIPQDGKMTINMLFNKLFNSCL